MKHIFAGIIIGLFLTHTGLQNLVNKFIPSVTLQIMIGLALIIILTKDIHKYLNFKVLFK